MIFLDTEFDCADIVSIEVKDGSVFEGMVVDIDIDFEGTPDTDSIQLLLHDKSNISFYLGDISSLTVIKEAESRVLFQV